MGKEKFKMSPAELKKAWKAGHATKDEFSGGGFEPDDGRYIVAVTLAEQGESKASGRQQVVWEYMFLDADYKGKTFRSYDGMDKPERLPYIMRRIEALGYESPEELDGLDKVLSKITKDRPKVRIKIQMKGEFRNVYIDKLLDDEDADVDTETAPETEKEEKEERVQREQPETPASEAQVDIEVGLSVITYDEDDKEDGKGVITAVNEQDEEVTVKLEDGKKVILPVSKIAVAPKPAAAKPKLKARA